MVLAPEGEAVVRTKVIKAVDARMISVSLEGAPTMPVWRMFSMHSTGSLLPERAEFRWENGQLVRMAVYGKRIKTNGEVGLADSSTQFVQFGQVLKENPIPDWLALLVEEHTP